MQTVVVFCHLRWSFVYQRPQHLVSRLAAHHRVLFVEEPIRISHGEPFIRATDVAPGVTVLTPHTSVEAPGFHDDQISILEPLLANWLEDAGATRCIAWLYTPMALPLLAALSPLAVVYDCMDELSAFKAAPRQLRQRETALMREADLVLTGGPSLYEAKRRLHANVLCIPSAVDAEHFSARAARSRPERLARAADLHHGIPHPRLGFYGVVDERLDLELVAAIADADPRWQVVMVGPVVKIDPALLPRRPNLHWLPQQPYELLPAILAQWDVCLLPFALNESTQFISPTKTLEYMAFGRPVVSTAVRDVVDMYGHVVAIGQDTAGFVGAIRLALAETADDRERRARIMAATVERHSWSSAVARIVAALRDIVPEPMPRHGASAGSAPARVRGNLALPAEVAPRAPTSR